MIGSSRPHVLKLATFVIDRVGNKERALIPSENAIRATRARLEVNLVR